MTLEGAPIGDVALMPPADACALRWRVSSRVIAGMSAEHRCTKPAGHADPHACECGQRLTVRA